MVLTSPDLDISYKFKNIKHVCGYPPKLHFTILFGSQISYVVLVVSRWRQSKRHYLHSAQKTDKIRRIVVNSQYLLNGQIFMVVVIIGDNHYMLLYTLSAQMQPVYFHKTTLVLETFLPMNKKVYFWKCARLKDIITNNDDES